MKTIVYFADGSIEETAMADQHVTNGIARYATYWEIRSYNGQFEQDDARAKDYPDGPWYSAPNIMGQGLGSCDGE